MISYDLPGQCHEARHFGGSAPKAPPPPPPPPSKTDAEIQAERAKANAVIRNRKGRGASLLNPETGTNFLQPGEAEGTLTLG